MRYLLLLLVFTFLKALAFCQGGYGSFGNPCSENFLCNSSALLSCQNGTCNCPSDTYHDSEKGLCIILAGKSCGYTTVDKVHCVDNAHCNDGNYCRCYSDFYETSEGTCVPKKSHGESCENSGQCKASTYQDLICTGGKCDCNATESFYDQRRKECVDKIGISCMRSSTCMNPFGEPHLKSCEYSKSCTCSTGYERSPDGSCLGTYGEQCVPGITPCVEGLSCLNGKCQCPFQAHQKYEYESGKCLSYVNGPCLETRGDQLIKYECLGEAECRKDNGFPECLCKQGYNSSDDGVCRNVSALVGATCENGIDCAMNYELKLNCKEGKCSCDDFQVYDESLNKCVGLWGAKCLGHLDCSENAHCQTIHPGNTWKAGICRCNAGSKVDSNRKCIRGS